MTPDELDAYIRSIGLTVEIIEDKNKQKFSVIRDLKIPHGALAGRTCDVAVQRPEGPVFTMPTGIHTRPALVPMEWKDPLKTKTSDQLGEAWQYWSRRLDAPPTPKTIYLHILTILTEVKV